MNLQLHDQKVSKLCMNHYSLHCTMQLSHFCLPLHSSYSSLVHQTCSSPRNEKYGKSSTGKYVVPHEQIIRVNPNGGKQGGIHDKESPGIANPNGDPSFRQTELITRCQRDNSNEDPSWRQKELIPRCQRDSSNEDPSWRQKELIPFGARSDLLWYL